MDYSLNSQNFEQDVLKSSIPVLVDFSADWCGPCKMMAPVVDKIAEKYEGRIKVCKLNVDEAIEVAREYGVMSIPTIMVVKNGEITYKEAGLLQKAQLKGLL